ncbi:GRAS family protein RAM1-like [Citrus sinensis]|uniref:DELLA protein RGL2 n=1 Tax=Citrus clementina TaxID=85681 RepID=UPI000CED5525|nr:DELLA protein RGL2 [Citrus x clementina]XP_006488992.2 GRAS family protein RAM1-like [Citrus sinensis]
MAGFRELSTVDVIRAATAIYLQSSSHSSSNLSLLYHFCGGSAINISEEESKDVELVHLLILCAEKIGSQQFDRASTLLDHCENFSSKIGNSVERVVHYFVKALQERFNRETGKITSKRVKGEEIKLLQPEETILSLRPALVACYKESSFYQATLFAGTQAIIERVASAKRIHLIDLAIRSGSHCMVLMQALATRQECPVKLLKITAVGSSSKQRMEETGKRLAYFAETWNLPFSFKIVMVTETKDLNEDKFDLNAGEAVAVYSPILLSRTRHPDFLIKMLRKISPCVMVIIEVEANHNSQNFEDRFFEVLFHYSASFDCLKVSMARCDPERVTFEEMYLGQHIRNIIATEGEERIFRHMKIDAWRKFFHRFGMVEAELSTSSLFQAELDNSFLPVVQYAGMQAIAENVASAKRVISLTLQSEVEHTQPLATRQECPLELLKATAVRTTSKQKVEETGKMFAYFAETLNLPFSSKIAFATETRDLRKGIFELNTGEELAV